MTTNKTHSYCIWAASVFCPCNVLCTLLGHYYTLPSLHGISVTMLNTRNNHKQHSKESNVSVLSIVYYSHEYSTCPYYSICISMHKTARQTWAFFIRKSAVFLVGPWSSCSSSFLKPMHHNIKYNYQQHFKEARNSYDMYIRFKPPWTLWEIFLICVMRSFVSSFASLFCTDAKMTLWLCLIFSTSRPIWLTDLFISSTYW